jgi:hypothetical protein
MRELIHQAAARLRLRDELCVIDEFAEIDPGFRKMSSGLAEKRALNAIVLEDPMFSQPLPAGQYAFVSGQSQQWHRIDLDDRMARKSSEDLRAFRQAHRGALSACGWHVTHALDILPSHDQAPRAAK